MPLHTRIPLTERLAITPRTHAWLDYLTTVPLMVLPRMLGARPGVQKAAAAMAAAQVGYAALTDHPGGVCPVIPMEAHRAIDIVAGSTLIALPFLLDEEDPGVTATLIGLGVFYIGAAAITRTKDVRRDRGMVTPMDDYSGSRKDGLGAYGTPVDVSPR